MLSDEEMDARLEPFRAKYGKVGGVEFSGHVLVFKRPTREHIRDYRRKKESDVEKVDAMDQLAQITIVAFDGEDDPNRARMTFTGVFLVEYPMAISNPRFVACLSTLAGLVDEEEAKELGKGVRIKGPPPPTSPRA